MFRKAFAITGLLAITFGSFGMTASPAQATDHVAVTPESFVNPPVTNKEDLDEFIAANDFIMIGETLTNAPVTNQEELIEFMASDVPKHITLNVETMTATEVFVNPPIDEEAEAKIA